ncbi:MAG: DUF1330 domain-containing protein [Solirubrobacterales bacterium]|nr:DUF1330 domain-containing protein [Solirubrobacterales bacterium]
MKHYVVAEINISDSSWIRKYVAHVTGMVERHGGRYLPRTPNVEKLEGDRLRPQLLLIIEWPSKEAAMAFYNRDEYKPFRASRRAGSSSEFLLVAGEDINRLAQV